MSHIAAYGVATSTQNWMALLSTLRTHLRFRDLLNSQDVGRLIRDTKVNSGGNGE